MESGHELLDLAVLPFSRGASRPLEVHLLEMYFVVALFFRFASLGFKRRLFVFRASVTEVKIAKPITELV